MAVPIAGGGKAIMKVTWTGEVDLASIEELDEQLVSAGATAAERVVLDMRDVTFVGSSGLRAILRARDRLEARGASLVVVRPPAHVFKLFTLTGAARTLQWTDRPLSAG